MKLLTALAVLTLGATVVLADSLTMIAPLGADTATSGRAITPDGKYVVGQSGTAVGFLYDVAANNTINILSSDNAQATIATGVGYRTVGGQNQIIIAGMSSGYVTEWMTPDGGTSFGPKRRNTAFTSNVQPAFNSLGAGVGSDAYYVSSWINANGSSVYLNQGTGPWLPTFTYSSKGITSTDSSRMNGVSASGRTVGWRINGGIRKNYMLTWNGTATPAAAYFNGLVPGSDAGQAFSVSADGSIVFGHSPIPTDAANNYGYKVVNPGVGQTINPLPEFANTGGSTSRAIPYGASADGHYAVGMQYRGTEKAVLWDTSDIVANWSVIDLTDLASSQGILDGFTRLTRAYSVASYWDESAMQVYAVVTGQGVWSPDGGVTSYTRGYVMTVAVPEPGTGALLGMGLLGLLALRRRK